MIIIFLSCDEPCSAGSASNHWFATLLIVFIPKVGTGVLYLYLLKLLQNLQYVSSYDCSNRLGRR